MRWRPLTWLVVSLLCFLGALWFWRLGDEWAARNKAARLVVPDVPASPTSGWDVPPAPRVSRDAFGLLSQPPENRTVQNSALASQTNRFRHRLSNTAQTI